MTRLEEIKKLHSQIEHAYSKGDPLMEVCDMLGKLFTEEHTDWLISQAEKLEAIEYEIDNSDMGIGLENIIQIVKEG